MLPALNGKRPQHTKLNVRERLQKDGIRSVFPVEDKGKPSLEMDVPKRVARLRYLPHRIAHLLNIARSPVDKSKHTVKKTPWQATPSTEQPYLNAFMHTSNSWC